MQSKHSTMQENATDMNAVPDDVLNQAEKGVPVEEAAPAEAASYEKIPQRRRKIWVGIAMIAFLAAVGLIVGLVVRSQKQKNETNGSGLVGSSIEADATPSTPPSRHKPSPTKAPGADSTIPPTVSTPTTPVPPTESPVDSTTSPPITTSTPAEEALFYRSTSGIFNVTLPLFSSSVALGYSDESELERDLVEALKFKVNRIVEQPLYYYAERPVDDVAEDGAAGDTAASPPVGSPAAGNVDDYETNTVEATIDEGDLLKTNGVHAFAAYGQYVVVWDVATGDQITNITLPALNYSGHEPPIEPIEPYAVNSARGSDGTRRNERDLQIVADEWYYWPVEPTVQSLLLYQDRLVVIANGYGQFVRSTLDYRPALYDAFSTNIRLYDISKLGDTGEVAFLNETHVHGTFNSIRADENRVHLVTFSGLDVWTYLEQPLDRYLNFPDLDDQEYNETARQLAEEKLIPDFVSRLMQDLSVHGVPANIARISMWQKHISTDSQLEDTVFGQGVVNYYAQVTSFDMLQTLGELKMSVSGALMPTGWGHTYATDKMLVIAGQGWDWIAEMNGSLQTTYLLGFALQNDGQATPAAVGSLEGSLLNEYSVDVVDNHMRVAVTIQNNMWTFALEGESDVNAEVATPRTENYVVVLEIPEVDAATSESGAILKEVGRTESLGEDGEVFMSVRFSDLIAYAVTFERTDPFYVISFENATNPKVLGELKITGFASYLHFVNDANTLLLGVGQEAGTDGGTLGLQVTLYNATKPTEPAIVDRFPVELDQNVYSSSTAEWDFKAFRYVKLDDAFGILIIPLRVDSYYSTEGNFDGFILLDVSSNGISERFRIPHVDSADFRLGCYYWARLAERSFVVDGNVTTLKGHSIRNYNLDSAKRWWGIDLDEGRVEEGDQCIYW